jgi:hypothetical protein
MSEDGFRPLRLLPNTATLSGGQRQLATSLYALALCCRSSPRRNGLSVRLQDSDLVVGRLLIGVIGVGSSAFVDKWILKAIFPGPRLLLCQHRCSTTSRCVSSLLCRSYVFSCCTASLGPAMGPRYEEDSTSCGFISPLGRHDLLLIKLLTPSDPSKGSQSLRAD